MGKDVEGWVLGYSFAILSVLAMVVNASSDEIFEGNMFSFNVLLKMDLGRPWYKCWSMNEWRWPILVNKLSIRAEIKCWAVGFVKFRIFYVDYVGCLDTL
jgi:hypothetical protein